MAIAQTKRLKQHPYRQARHACQHHLSIRKPKFDAATGKIAADWHHRALKRQAFTNRTAPAASFAQPDECAHSPAAAISEPFVYEQATLRSRSVHGIVEALWRCDSTQMPSILYRTDPSPILWFMAQSRYWPSRAATDTAGNALQRLAGAVLTHGGDAATFLTLLHLQQNCRGRTPLFGARWAAASGASST